MEFKNIRRLLSYMRQAVDQYDMIEDGDRIAVAVSGGKDSLALLAGLWNLRMFYPKHFDVCAITVDMGFEGADFSAVKDFCESMDIEYRIVGKEDYLFYFLRCTFQNRNQNRLPIELLLKHLFDIF